MKKYSLILLLAGLLAACVTINIYFPAAEAQKVADEIIDDVWQIKDGEQTQSPEASKDAPSDQTDNTPTAE
ncbi:MAG: hypothetical protein ACMZ63_09565 [Methylotenera sp.]|jgi:hypothetical protein